MHFDHSTSWCVRLLKGELSRTTVASVCQTIAEMTKETPMQRADRVLGRLVLRTWAIVAFIAAVVSAAFGAAVLRSGQIPGLLILVVGALFFWLGLRAWRDRAGCGAMLTRDFERMPRTGAKNAAHGDDR